MTLVNVEKLIIKPRQLDLRLWWVLQISIGIRDISLLLFCNIRISPYVGFSTDILLMVSQCMHW